MGVWWFPMTSIIMNKGMGVRHIFSSLKNLLYSISHPIHGSTGESIGFSGGIPSPYIPSECCALSLATNIQSSTGRDTWFLLECIPIPPDMSLPVSTLYGNADGLLEYSPRNCIFICSSVVTSWVSFTRKIRGITTFLPHHQTQPFTLNNYGGEHHS